MAAQIQFRNDNPFETHRVYLSLDAVDRFTARGVRQGFFNIGRTLKRTANKNILDKSQKTGRIYIFKTQSGRRKRHQASAPGETHANLTGDLRKAVAWKVYGSDELKFEYGVDGLTPPPYDTAIEFGTKDGRILARPSLRNAIFEIDRDAEVYFEEAIMNELEP